MDNKIILDLSLFKSILDQQARTLVGKVCKRFEISKDLESIKLAVKELIYEDFRNVSETLITGKIILNASKEKEQ